MTKSIYNHKNVENNWKDKWYKDNIYAAIDFSSKPKKYILAELPYPSGKSLHVGHMMRYTVPEIYSRFLRMQGYNVLFPMGWDCFGLPAETFAIKEKTTPQKAIAQATHDYKKAMQDIGYGIDWDREITTSDPSYYKWTQWMFKKLWEKGLAIQQEMPVWWCKELGVLADEEVLPSKDGTGKISERGGYNVERKPFKQWVLNIPAYADRLISDLDKTSYKENVKTGQINWINRKEGALVMFKAFSEVCSCKKECSCGNACTCNDLIDLNVFTTRPDTIYGVTFLAIAPEHPLVEKLIAHANNKEELLKYIDRSRGLSDIEKQTKEKTGVKIEGMLVKHPFLDKCLPVFLADYILLDYGTGVVMGVPAHDDRDNEFAKKYDLEIIKVIDAKDALYTGSGKMINSDEYTGLDSEEFKKVIAKRLEQDHIGGLSVTYKLRPQVFSRQRYWGEPIPLVYKQDGSLEALEDTSLPLELPIMEDFLPAEDGTSPLAKNIEWNSTKDKEGNTARRETDTMPTWAGSNWYYMRYIDPKNDKAPADMEKLKYWMPVDMYFGDAGHTTAHLLYSRFWYKFLYDIGVVPADEPYDFRMSGGMLLGPDGQKMSKSKGNVINPQEVLDSQGADAVRTYLAFIGPYEDTYPWNPRGLNACAKLVKSIYELKDAVKDQLPTTDEEKTINKAIKNMTQMMAELKMNTSVSEVMILVNALKKQDTISKNTWKKLILLVAPFMPFVAEELWQEINEYKEWKKENSVHIQTWPTFDETTLVENTLTLAVQVNGKVRGTIQLALDTSEEDAITKALEDTNVQKYVPNKDAIKKTVYVKGKILNLVI